MKEPRRSLGGVPGASGGEPPLARRRRVAVAAASLGAMLVATEARAITNGVPPSPTDTRYDAIAALSFAHWLGLDPVSGALSPTCGGAANCQQDNWFCNATLIAPDVVVTAKHCVDSPTSTYALRFRRKADGTLGTLAGGAGSYHHVLVAEWRPVPFAIDMLFAVLAQPVTHISPIGALVDGAGALRGGTPVALAGWGKQGPGFNQGPLTELRTCRATLSTGLDIGLNTTVPGIDPPGCQVNMHDSGSPVLLEGPAGALRTIGVTTAVGGGSSFINVLGLPGVPLVHVPFPGANVALFATHANVITAPDGSSQVSLVARDVGSVASAGVVPVSLALVRAGRAPVALGTTSLPLNTQVTRALDLSAHLPLPADWTSYQVQAESQLVTDVLPWDDVAQGAGWWSVSPNPSDVAAIRTGWVLDPQTQLVGYSVLVERSTGTVDLVTSVRPLDLVETRLEALLPPGGSLQLSPSQGSLTLSRASTGPSYSQTVVTPTFTRTRPMFEAPRDGPSAHYQGIYVGMTPAGVAVSSAITGDGELTVFWRASSGPAFDFTSLGHDDRGAFASDGTFAEVSWDPQRLTHRLVLDGGATVPRVTLYRVGPDADADRDGFLAYLDCDDARARIHPGAQESCDGVDEDCDGLTDEGIDAVPVSCGIGACLATGQVSCVAGALVSDCTPRVPGPVDADCDGVDDDCDGAVDEDAACDAGAADASVPDAGAADAGAADAGVPDAGEADAGAADAGAADAGAADAGAADAGVPDAGAADAGAPDEGEAPVLEPVTGCGCRAVEPSGAGSLAWLTAWALKAWRRRAGQQGQRPGRVR